VPAFERFIQDAARDFARDAKAEGQAL